MTLEWDDQLVTVTDATHGTKNRYRLVAERGWQPFLLPAELSTYSERGRIGRFAWEDGDGVPGAGKNASIHQVLLLGARSKDGSAAANGRDELGFVRLFDLLGARLPGPGELLYSRPRGSVQPEMILETGGAARLLGPRPSSIPPEAHAAVGYISEAGALYYSPADTHIQVRTGPSGQWLTICYTHRHLTHENVEITVAPTSPDFVDEIFRRVPVADEAFLNGRLRIYAFEDNPDPGKPTQVVTRTAVVGITNEGKFGFLRIFDSLGQGAFAGAKQPTAHVLSSHDNAGHGRLNRELVLEAGAIDALL